MGGFLAQKQEARRALHGYMSVPALYFEWPLPAGTEPQKVTVRIHDNFFQVGDLKGTNFHYSEKYEYAPRAIFMRSEVNQPKRHMILSLGDGVAYRIDAVHPPDGITVAADVVRVRADEAASFPVPGE